MAIKLKSNPNKSLRTEFLGYFLISIVVSIIFGLISFYIIEKLYYKAKFESYEIEKENANNYLNDLYSKLEKLTDIDSLSNELIELNNTNTIYYISVVDENGEVLYKSSDDGLQQRDYILYRTVTIQNQSNIVFLEGDYIDKSYEEDILAMIIILISIVLFIFIFFRLANKRINYIHEISESVDKISKGDLDSPIVLSGNDELTNLADGINSMSQSIKERNEYEDQIEKSKKELITNMSHDLRTPLTSIIGYLNLIKDKNYENDKKLSEFVEICFNKSQQLKQLINRLFEYSKLTSENINLEKINLDVNRFINQIKGEYSHIVEKNNLSFELVLDKNKPFIVADPLLIVRVFENLIYNAVKYAKKPGILIIKSSILKDGVLITISNTIDKKQFNKDDMDNIFERMFIKDKSRSEGKSSGLGLAISREIVELNSGKIWAEIIDENIVFFLKFRKSKALED